MKLYHNEMFLNYNVILLHSDLIMGRNKIYEDDAEKMREFRKRKSDKIKISMSGWFVAKELTPLFEETFNEINTLRQTIASDEESTLNNMLKEKLASILRRLMTFQQTRQQIPNYIFEEIKKGTELKLPKFKPEDFEKPIEVEA